MTTVAVATENTALSNLGLSFSGSAAITSDYRFRGITQTQNDQQFKLVSHWRTHQDCILDFGVQM